MPDNIVQYWSVALEMWRFSNYSSLDEMMSLCPPQDHGKYRLANGVGNCEYAPGFRQPDGWAGEPIGPAHEITEQEYLIAQTGVSADCPCESCRSRRKIIASYTARQEILAVNQLAQAIQVINTTSQEVTVPTVPTPVNAAFVVPESSQASQAPNLLVDVGISRSKPTNRLELVVNAKALHDHLDLIGVPHTGGVYQDQPETNRVLSGSSLSTSPFLRREYPLRIDLTGVFTTPPTRSRLAALCRTAHDAVRRVLEHYQPVDIRVSIHKRVAG